MRLTSIRRRWRQRPEIFRRRWSVATPVGLHPSYVATDHRRFLTTNPGGTPLIIRGKLFRQPRPALSPTDKDRLGVCSHANSIAFSATTGRRGLEVCPADGGGAWKAFQLRSPVFFLQKRQVISR